MSLEVQEVLNGRRPWALIHGDSAEVLRTFPESAFHAAVMDPPSGIEMFGKKWDADRGGRDRWIDWLRGIMERVYRTLRPGGYAAVWALPRTSHWTATAVENAGFEIRDRIHDVASADEALAWFAASLDDSQREALVRLIDSQASPILHHLFGNGMLKGVNVYKSLDKAAGVKPIRVEPATLGVANNAAWNELKTRHIMPPPTTPEAKQWAGWYSNLRPGAEHWILARKPLGKRTLPLNVVGWGTGALNLGGVRDKRMPNNVTLRHAPGCVPGRMVKVRTGKAHRTKSGGNDYSGKPKKPQEDITYADADGKESVVAWDCVPGCPIAMVDQQSYEAGIHSAGSKRGGGLGTKANQSSFRGKGKPDPSNGTRYGDGGGASRFFPNVGPTLYIPKAPPKEKNAGCEHLPKKDWRQGAKSCTPRSGQIFEQVGRKGKPRPNHHPTCKAVGLMTWLLKLVCVEGGAVLDPFAGSGSTGVAALGAGMRFVGIEKESEYVPIARARLRHATPGDPPTTIEESMFKGFA